MKALCSDGLKRHKLYSDIKMNGEVKIGTIYWWDLDFALRGGGKGPKKKIIVYRISQITP